MKFFLPIALALTLAARLVYGAEKLEPMTGVDLVCPMSASITVNLNSKAHQVWFAQPGAREGQALAISSFEVLRCPLCFRFAGEIDTDGLQPGEIEKSVIQGTTHSEGFGTPAAKIFLDFEVLSGTDQMAQKKNIPCNLPSPIDSGSVSPDDLGAESPR